MAASVRLYSPGADHKENTSCRVSPLLPREQTIKRTRLRFPYCWMTSLPERTPKKTAVPLIVALLSNGCKQAFPLLTVDLQRARYNTFFSLLYQPRMMDEYGAFGKMRIARGNLSIRKKPATVPLCPPQIPRDLGSNPGCRGRKPDTNRPSYGTTIPIS
jgi:hypothetical protein